MASYLTQNGVSIENLPCELGNQVAQDAISHLADQYKGNEGINRNPSKVQLIEGAANFTKSNTNVGSELRDL